MKPVILIPARYESTRFPGKPLAPLNGRDGTKTLIQRTWEQACEVLSADSVFICTDDKRIEREANSFGADVIMTSDQCPNGTARCAEAVQNRGIGAEIIVNFQGDAPLTPPWFVSDLIAAISADTSAQVATPVLRCDSDTLRSFQADRQAHRVGGTTAVFDKEMNALYFSKETIPYSYDLDALEQIPVFHHVGVYAFRRNALLAYPDLEEGILEKVEGLEQLRFMENQIPVKCVEVNARDRHFWELNNPSDIELIERELMRETT